MLFWIKKIFSKSSNVVVIPTFKQQVREQLKENLQIMHTQTGYVYTNGDLDSEIDYGIRIISNCFKCKKQTNIHPYILIDAVVLTIQQILDNRKKEDELLEPNDRDIIQ